MKIEKFEELDCWQEARQLVKMVYKTVSNGKFALDVRLRDQMTGAAVSIMNNIAEGFTSQSNLELKRFLRYSRRSTAEVQSCLYVAVDQKYLPESEFTKIYEQAKKARQLIDGFIRYLRTKQTQRT